MALTLPAGLPQSREKGPLLLIVGGGTVGHLAPGFAVAEVLARRGVAAVFVTPGDAREAKWFPANAAPRLVCPAPRWPRSRLEWPFFPARLTGAVLRALALLRRVRPHAVLGLGGWPCVPTALASCVARIPLGLIASDEQAGFAVRCLAPMATRVYAARRTVAESLGRRGHVVHTGPVLRSLVLEARPDPSRFGFQQDRLTLLVTGGSLGAAALNRALSQGIGAAVAEDPRLAQRIQVIHSTGESGEGVAAAYREAGIPFHVTAFLEDMGTAYRTADLVVSRAGALTCAELAAVGTPAVLVPYPHHADRQQYANAMTLVDDGGACLLEERDLTPESIRRDVIGLLLDVGRRAAMARSGPSARVDGALQIGADLVRLLRCGEESPT